MPSLDQHSASSIVRLLNIGENGTGKTGALASLALAGYSLHILDYDNGLDILANVLRERGFKDWHKVNYTTLRDKVIHGPKGMQVKAPPTAFNAAGATLKEWKADEFGPQDVIVLDTLSGFTEAGMNAATFAGGRLNDRPQLQDWGWMADRTRLFIEMLTSDDMKCNLIVNTHIRYFSGDDETSTQARGVPNAKGQEIPRTIARYFNTVTLSRSVGSGPGTKRVISTQPQGVVEVKTSNPIGVKPQYPIDTGLADLFRDLTGSAPKAAN